jgi:hypothetical protein
MKDKIGAVAYMECSAMKAEGCIEAILAGLAAVVDDQEDEVTGRTQSKGLFSRLFR